MCGIAGFTHRNHVPAPDRIETALSLLAHRGPDRQAAFRSHFISLGATRLKVLDLSSGDQPMTDASGDTVIAFNGEIYNHCELREELERRGHKFRSRTDTETVLAAFLEWDVECFARLRGMFAVALWTESRKRLVLARDRLGIKPLYIAKKHGDVFFGSELKAIFVHPEIDRQLNMAALDCYLSLNYVPCPWTLVDGIEKVRPGCWLEWRDGDLCSGTYWELPFGSPVQCDPQAAQTQLEGLLSHSIREHLLTDVPLGVWLSGGLDSSAILHYASAASSKPLKTFSISFNGRSFDETDGIRKTVAHYGTEHYEFDVNANTGLQDAIEEFAYFADEPTADAGALPVWFLSKLTKGNATVALSGEGADELFGGYLTYRADRLASLARLCPKAVLQLALRGAERWPVSDEKIGFDYKLNRFLAGCQMSEARAHVYWNGTFSEAEKEALLGAPPSGDLDRLLRSDSMRRGGLNAHLWFDQKYFLPDDILAKVDRISMAHSIEVRPPFLDHRIVEFAATLPAHFKMSGSRQKVVLRELMRSKLPSHVFRQKKVGLDIPAHEWLRGPLRPLLLDTMSSAKSEFGHLFRPAEIDRLVQRHLSRRANLGYHLWGLMILFLWMRQWKIQTAVLSSSLDQTLASSVPIST